MKHFDNLPINLALTANGQVALCRGCHQCITVEFGPILQLFGREDFVRLQRNIGSTSPPIYFEQCPYRSKIVINTTSPDLYFTFTETEFYELQHLLNRALTKLQLIEATEQNLN
ncbi:DUF6686 family protein [Arundinibacter roseus]|uniref:Uncharacterized protein n=1 Tax=Arundinibacter roseus TaxID=2070510 RepID=A0A4V2X9G6_9BACT|nr:DUF6686 family protein [Arundinibacter roseus]TDB63715.1 hypothetical protein EZE20_15570 [Arundinibacter roseus]